MKKYSILINENKLIDIKYFNEIFKVFFNLDKKHIQILIKDLKNIGYVVLYIFDYEVVETKLLEIQNAIVKSGVPIMVELNIEKDNVNDR